MASLLEFPVLLDWLTFSCHFSSFQEVIKFLGLEKYEDYFKPSAPRWFYKTAVTYNNEITIYLSQKSDINMCCVNMSGSGCRFFESFSTVSLDDLLYVINFDDDFNCSRCDIAMDVIDDKFKIETLVRATEKDNYLCRSKFRNIMNSLQNGIQAYSLYFGRKESNIFVNIYDKRAERGYSPEDMPNWVRIEIRLRHENAVGFLKRYFVNDMCDLGCMFVGVLNNYLRFVSPSKDSNKSRWNTAPYWKKLLSHCEAVKVFYKPGVEYNYSKYENDLIKRCGSSIKTFYELGHTAEELKQLIELAGVEPNPKQQFLIDNYLGDDIDFAII